MKTDIIQRINELMIDHELSQTAFSERTAIAQSNLSKILAGKRPCGEAIINKIAMSFDINKTWLETGEGDRYTDNIKVVPKDSLIKPYFKEHSVRYVPVMHIDSVGGMHSENEITAGEQYFERLIPFEEAREGDIAIYQSGDSMSPSIPSGSLLLLRKVEDWKEYIGYGNVFVLWLRDDRRITKMVTRYDEDPKNYVWCVSYNPNVPDEELPRKMIREVWKVVKFQTNLGW